LANEKLPDDGIDVDLLMDIQKKEWKAELPDGKEIIWYPYLECLHSDDFRLIAKIQTIIETVPLKLNYYQVLPATSTNPYSVRMALEVLYSGQGKIKYSGNVPDFNDVIKKIPPTAIE